MNKTLIGSIAAMFLLSTACTKQAPPPAPAATQPTKPAIETPAITEVTLSRTACHGVCPVYTVVVNSTGQIYFVGEEHVTTTGPAQGTLSPDQYAALTRSIESAGFFDWQDKYASEQDGCEAVTTDSPSVSIEATRNGQKKRVDYYYGCRGLPLGEKIDGLAKAIDDAANTRQWVGEPAL